MNQTSAVHYEFVPATTQELHRVAFIMGWGNTLNDPWLKWFKEMVAEENRSVLVIAIPCEYTSFNTVLNDIKVLIEEHQCEILLSHSMGGLFSRFIDTECIIQRIFLSPFWKVPKRTLILGSYPISKLLISLLRWIKTPLLYRNFEDEDIGIIDLPKDVPRNISPCTMHEVIKAQSNMPPLKNTDTIIYCPDDKVIDTSVCSGLTYAGGHFAFTVSERDVIFQMIVSIIDR